jgi:hypothetical protein
MALYHPLVEEHVNYMEQLAPQGNLQAHNQSNEQSQALQPLSFMGIINLLLFLRETYLPIHTVLNIYSEFSMLLSILFTLNSDLRNQAIFLQVILLLCFC